MTDETTKTKATSEVASPVDVLVSCGLFEGEKCNREGCGGEIETKPVDNCSCHINPPCAACTAPRNFCPECGWEQEDEPIEELKSTGKSWVQPKPRSLDNTRIDWRYKPHTHFTMIKYGVYPEGTTMAEVRKEVDGTFGGRFNYFGNGKFEFVAYTD